MTVIGVGLIGGSLALAAKRAKLVKQVVGYSKRRGDLYKAVATGVLDRYCLNLSKAVQEADLVVLATPVGVLEAMARAISPHLKAGAIVTDVGSVKGLLVSKMEACLPNGTFFVGGHPIAGSEKSGVLASLPTLFDRSVAILTPTPHTDRKALVKVAQFWKGMGTSVVEMDPIKHDQTMAVVSHLPHLLAYGLMELFYHPRVTMKPLSFSAGSLRDFTRVAESSPELWSQIFQLNKTAVIETIDLYQETLEKMKKAILASEKGSGDDLLKILGRAKEVRKRITG
jgi:prephenate dehydrogenase